MARDHNIYILFAPFSVPRSVTDIRKTFTKVDLDNKINKKKHCNKDTNFIFLPSY